MRGSLVSFTPRRRAAGRRTPIPTAPNSSVGVAAASEVNDQVYYGVEGFLAPSHLWQADAADRRAGATSRTCRARFDASGDTVDQYEATSTDGTKIPYFVVHPKAMKLDGSNPTILYAYGGFQVSMLPAYSGAIGKLWLEHGGVYRAGQHPRRRRVRAGLARGRAEDPAPARSTTTSPRWRRT